MRMVGHLLSSTFDVAFIARPITNLSPARRPREIVRRHLVVAARNFLNTQNSYPAP